MIRVTLPCTCSAFGTPAATECVTCRPTLTLSPSRSRQDSHLSLGRVACTLARRSA